MTLFAASVIIWLRAKTPRDASDSEAEEVPCHLWERVVLVRASDPDEALQRASQFGLRDAEMNSEDLIDNGKPAELVFMGVRKLREVDQPVPADWPDDVVEVSASEMEVKNRGDLLKLAQGGDVLVRYID